MSKRTFSILVCCQDLVCAEHVSYPIDMLRWWQDEPICQECFSELPYQDRQCGSGEDVMIEWSDLEPLKMEEARP